MTTNVTLITTGSHNPPHPGHLNMLAIAREHLEKQGYTVIKSIISPSHDTYVMNKYYSAVEVDGHNYQRPKLDAKKRRKIWKCLLKNCNDNSLELNKLESKQLKQFVEHTDVVSMIKGNIKDDSLVIYVAGEDMGKSCMSLWHRCPSFNVLCIARDSKLDTDFQKQMSAYKQTGVAYAGYITNPLPTCDMSSTKIMQANPSCLSQLPFEYILSLLKSLPSDTHQERAYFDVFSKKVLMTIKAEQNFDTQQNKIIEAIIQSRNKERQITAEPNLSYTLSFWQKNKNRLNALFHPKMQATSTSKKKRPSA